MTAIEGITIVLSLVALIVTVIGFFASLKFYRDGMSMQSSAQKALTMIEEKAVAIQSQVGGMFEKTLEAAIGQASPQEAERSQREALERGTREEAGSGAESADSKGGGLFAGGDLAVETVKFYAFRRMRITDVSDPNARAIFNLGYTGGFNLLDGTHGLLFIGFFTELDLAEVVARTRMLFNSIDVSYKRLDEPLVDPITRAQAISLLARISVDLIVADGANTRALLKKVDEFQPEYRSVEVSVRTPAQMKDELEEEYRKMSVAS